MALRGKFPVLEHTAYLNSGTDGPIPRAAADQAREELAAEAAEGRLWTHFERRRTLTDDLRAGYARVLHCEPDDVAVTSGTSAGLGYVLAGLDLGPGDEVVTSDDEHPGLIGPLIAARQRGATVREVPFSRLADAVDARTTLVAASHVNWITGEISPADLAEVPVPVILDGAQGAGAIDVDVKALNCAAYAAAGQKWLCGRRFDGQISREAVALSLTALNVLEQHGLASIFDSAADLADRFAAALAEAGYTIAPRGRSTLVSFEHPDPPAARERLAAAGVAVRHLPGRPYLRASVGAWNDESDLERLLEAL
jgi:L-cysteine/cystine lyase